MSPLNFRSPISRLRPESCLPWWQRPGTSCFSVTAASIIEVRLADQSIPGGGHGRVALAILPKNSIEDLGIDRVRARKVHGF